MSEQTNDLVERRGNVAEDNGCQQRPAVSFSSWLPSIALSIASLAWAGNALVGRSVRDSISPDQLSFYRWVLTAIVLGFWHWRSIKREYLELLANWKMIAAGGILGMAGFHTFQYAALAHTSALNVTLIIGITPVLVGVVAWLRGEEKPSLERIVEVTLCVAGVIVVTSHSAMAKSRTYGIDGGVILAFVATVCWAAYAFVVRRPHSLSPGPRMFGMSLAAAISLFPFWIASDHVTASSIDRARDVMAIAYVSICASAVAYSLFNFGVVRLGATRASQFTCLVPVFAAVLSSVVFRIDLTIYDILALSLIVAGINFGQLLRKIRTLRYLPRGNLWHGPPN